MRIVGGIPAIYRAAYSGLPRTVWWLAASTFVARAGLMVLPFLTLYLVEVRGLAPEVAGRILGLYGVGSVAGSWLGGALADRLGAVRVTVLSYAAGGVGLLSYIGLESLPALAVGTFLVSLVAEAHRPGFLAAATEASPPAARPRSLGLIRTAMNLGTSIGPAVGGLLATVSYALLFVANGAALWLAAGILLLSLGWSRDGTEHEGPRECGAGARLSPWRDITFLAFLGLVTCLAASFFQILSTWPLTLRDQYGLSEAGIGALLGFNALVIVLFELPLLKVVERAEPLRVAALGTFLVGGGMALLPFGSTYSWALVSVAVWTVGEMLALPLTNAVVASRAPAGSRGSYMGAYSVAFSVAFAVAPAVGTEVYGRFGTGALWTGIGLLGAAVAVGFVAVSEPMSRPPAAAVGDP